MPYTIKVRQHFSAAHFLRGYPGKCEEVHGHNYSIEVWLESKELNKSGLVYDFRKLKKQIQKILPDHKLLNKLFKFNPTAENLAKYFYDELKKRFSDRVRVKKIVVWENEDCAAEYEP